MGVKGTWHPPGLSRGHEGVLDIRSGIVSVRINEAGQESAANVPQDCDLSEVRISDRLGNVPTSITFPDNSVFRTGDNHALDRLLSENKGRRSLVHGLESRWGWVALSVVLVLGMGFGSYRWGLPWLSETLAARVPDKVVRSVADNTLTFLDQFFMHASELEEEARQDIRRRFEVLAEHPEVVRGFSGELSLQFRKLGQANAFALPDGTVILTDAFVELMDDPRQVDSVLLHEIGHVVERHGMEQLVRSSIVAFTLAMLVGDPSGLEELFVALPVLLMQSSYSREHEREADAFALSRMIAMGLDPGHFADALLKLDPAAGARETGGGQEKEADSAQSALEYFSSHPVTAERIRKAREAAARGDFSR